MQGSVLLGVEVCVYVCVRVCICVTDTSSSQAAVTVSPADRNALAALLASPTRAAFSASAASPEAVAAARAEWTRALTSGTCAPQSPWTATLVEKISRATQVSAKPVDAPASQQSANTQSDMGAATRGITARITKGEQVSWEEACRLWDEYITQVAADPVERGALPSLADVINADAQLRQARSQAAAKAPGAAAALAAATERAAVINTQLDFAHRRFLERHPGGTFPLTAPGASTSGRGVAAATGVEAGMQRLRQFNNTLTKAFRAPAAMLTSFQVGFLYVPLCVCVCVCMVCIAVRHACVLTGPARTGPTCLVTSAHGCVCVCVCVCVYTGRAYPP